VQPASEPELYVHLLLADPARRGAGVGAQLLEHAREEAFERGIELLRVDCWAGGDGRLIAYYEAQGFTRTATFDADGWPGQVLEQRLSRPAAAS
jgi:GNAT superfamily N-acetyltransferase